MQHDNSQARAPSARQRRTFPSEETIALLVRSGLGGAAKRKQVSTRTIRRRFERMGQTVSDFVRIVRSDMVRIHIANGKPLSAIALLVGFNSTRSLARFIHQSFGMSPSELRGKLQSKAVAEQK